MTYENLLSFEGNFVPLHIGTVLIVIVYCSFILQKYNPIITVPTFYSPFLDFPLIALRDAKVLEAKRRGSSRL